MPAALAIADRAALACQFRARAFSGRIRTRCHATAAGRSAIPPGSGTAAELRAESGQARTVVTSAMFRANKRNLKARFAEPNNGVEYVKSHSAYPNASIAERPVCPEGRSEEAPRGYQVHRRLPLLYSLLYPKPLTRQALSRPDHDQSVPSGTHRRAGLATLRAPAGLVPRRTRTRLCGSPVRRAVLSVNVLTVARPGGSRHSRSCTGQGQELANVRS